MKTLKDLFSDWVDPDVACYLLAASLGMAPGSEDGKFEDFTTHKWVYCSSTIVGDALYEMLERLEKIGVLETDDGDRFRWNQSFDIGEWP